MNDRRIVQILTLTIGVTVAVGVSFFVIAAGRAGPLESIGGLPMILILVLILLIAVMLGVSIYMKRSAPGDEKLKRDQDMFSVIDDLVEDLTPDEVDYLREHVHAGGGDAGDNVAVEESMEALLDQRDRDRRAGLRE